MNYVGAVSRRMLSKLYTFATNPDYHNLDEVVASTFVNPAYQKMLNDKQEKRQKSLCCN